MIYDRIEKLQKYLPEEVKEPILSCIRNISAETHDDIIYIDGNNIYLRVMSYPTTLRECPIEAHNKYVDIQSVILGAEGIDVFDRSKMKVKTEYDEINDVVFFKEQNVHPVNYLSVFPGYFALLQPHEAHRPQIAVDDKPEVIKKFVIKLRREYFEK